MNTGKRYDDYLPGETRKQYVERRKKISCGTLVTYWPTCFVRHDGDISMTNGTLAGLKTQEYKRIKAWPQVDKHIEKIDAMFEEAK